MQNGVTYIKQCCMSPAPTQRRWSFGQRFCHVDTAEAEPSADGVESASARWPFDMGTTPLNDFLQERERAPDNNIPSIKPLINESYLKKPTHPRRQEARRHERR